MSNRELVSVAIVGAGPRGLSALESLYYNIAKCSVDKTVKTLLFEASGQLGNGQVYHMKQPDSNWLNVSDRGLTIPARQALKGPHFNVPAFPSYHDWSGFDREVDTGSKPDNFTTRSHMGVYLNQRFTSLADVLIKNGLLEVIHESIVHLDYKNNRFIIRSDKGKYIANECVLTVGHQPTKLDEQLSKWKTKVSATSGSKLFEYPYPIEDVKQNIQHGDVVALRGFGLAMIDVARALSEGMGGDFTVLDRSTRKMSYTFKDKDKVLIVPFSLNGLPMTPKPLSLNLDVPFIPTENELASFEGRLSTSVHDSSLIRNTRFLTSAIIPLIVQKFMALDERARAHSLSYSALEKIVEQWLEDGSIEHDLIISKSLAAYDSMQRFVDMATGRSRISLDYCIGQVWRHCQPTMYKALSFTDLDDEIIAEVIQLDERLKRYSYGPPVDSLTQMLALVDAGAMTLDFVNDPEISLTGKGWELKEGKGKIVANVMIDTVLDSPKLLDINSSLVKSLLEDSLVEPIHTSLGISTYKNALVELEEEREEIPLAVLGRLAKGSIIGVDAILECFGNRSDAWAKGVMERLGII